ncbi:hypothetical protein DL769_010234 [Monosporascus sp. CRB-8-3]|nr:hypothetical protein DL769_010234 [Monosporascus sp. CRB-8-3]
MCLDNSAKELCGHPTDWYYQMESCHHTDVGLCGSTNVTIMGMLYAAGFTTDTDPSQYDVHSRWFKDLAAKCHMSGFGSLFETFFFPLLSDRVLYYVHRADLCGAFEAGTPSTGTPQARARSGERKRWKRLEGWPAPLPVAQFMHDNLILHDERLDAVGITYAQLNDAQGRDGRSSPADRDEILHTDLLGLPLDTLQRLLRDGNRAFRKAALQADRLYHRLPVVREAAVEAQKRADHDPRMGPLPGDVDAMLAVDVSGLSLRDLDRLRTGIVGEFRKAVNEAAALKERCDEIYAELAGKGRV